MAWPGVLPLNFVTCFASLLDNEIPRVAFNDGFDCVLLVPRHDDEVCNVRRDAVVLSRRKLDRLHALVCRALAMEWQYLLDAMLFRAFLDPLIDRTKDFLVAGGRVREIHQHILP